MSTQSLKTEHTRPGAALGIAPMLCSHCAKRVLM
jgi:hypothetical protein